eukprot:Rhum_TRINITY_DN14409_c6_g1::Rhum_TRINITY_DN14409_c6_g1_i1::g.88326::m.88326
MDRLARLGEGDLRGACVPVVDNRVTLRAVPAVELHAAAPLQQRRLVHVGRGVAGQLVAREIRVVAGGDEVVGQRTRHVLHDVDRPPRLPRVVVEARQEGDEARGADLTVGAPTLDDGLCLLGRLLPIDPVLRLEVEAELLGIDGALLHVLQEVLLQLRARVHVLPHRAELREGEPLRLVGFGPALLGTLPRVLRHEALQRVLRVRDVQLGEQRLQLLHGHRRRVVRVRADPRRHHLHLVRALRLAVLHLLRGQRFEERLHLRPAGRALCRLQYRGPVLVHEFSLRSKHDHLCAALHLQATQVVVARAVRLHAYLADEPFQHTLYVLLIPDALARAALPHCVRLRVTPPMKYRYCS